MSDSISYFVVIRGRNPRHTLRKAMYDLPHWRYDDRGLPNLSSVYETICEWKNKFGVPEEIKIERIDR